MRTVRATIALLLIGMVAAEPALHVHRHLRATSHDAAIRTSTICAMCAARVGHAVVASNFALAAPATSTEEPSRMPVCPAVDDVLSLAISRAPPSA